MSDYQLIIIGGGPGGYVAAIKAAQEGFRTALVEQDKLGGTCLNRGCIPTKTMLHSANMYAECKNFEMIGLKAEHVSYDMEKIHQRKADVSETLRNGVEQLLKANGVDVIHGHGKVMNADTVTVGESVYTADRILIAAGSFPAKPPIEGINLPGVLTSDDILEGEVEEFSSIIIIGGGVIGVELASVYAALGCKVTIIEAMNRLIANMDKEFGQSLSMIMKKRGVQIYTGAKVERIIKGQELSCVFSKGDVTEEVRAERILVAVGRRPATAELFLENCMPEMERGYLKVNEDFETSIPGIYAIGDVIGGIQLAHKASAEGQAVVEKMAGKDPEIMVSVVPSCVYTLPEIASAGLTLEEAKKQGYEVKSAKYLMNGNGKSIIDLQERGFIKFVTDAKTDKILGVQMMCGRATDLISEFTQMIVNGMTYHQALRGMRPHPTYCEGITEALEALDGCSIHSMPKRR